MKGNATDIHKCEDKILKNKKDIEQEFKDLKFIHQHDVSTNETTIYEHQCLNGSFATNYIISLANDSFISFQHEMFIPQSLGEFWSFYESHKRESNIFIDSRAVPYIAYAILRYADDVLVYDVYSGSCVSVYMFCSKFFNIQTNEITFSQIKQLFASYLILVVYGKRLDIEWNTSSIIKCIKTNDMKTNAGEGNLNIFDVIIDYCKVKTSYDISTKNINYIIGLFEECFTSDAYTPTCTINPVQEWKMNKISVYEFLVTLTLLKNSGFQLSYVK